MKSFHLALTFSIALLASSCGIEQTARLDSREPGDSSQATFTDVKGEQQDAGGSQAALPSSAILRKGILPSGSSDLTAQGGSSKEVLSSQSPTRATVLKQSRSIRYSDPAPIQGRSNPFALAEQPEFEVRFLAAATPAARVELPQPFVSDDLPLSGEDAVSPHGSSAVVEQLPVNVPQVTILPATSITPLPTQLPEQLPDIPTISPVADEAPPVSLSPTALAEAVEIQGVVQLGGQSMVIVKDSADTLSRTVQPGARLAGGEVELRRIDTTTAEPQVILVQNGIEIVRGIGV